MVPSKVEEGVFGKGCAALRAVITGTTTMARPSRPWRWRWPHSSGIVFLLKPRMDVVTETVETVEGVVVKTTEVGPALEEVTRKMKR
jgi:hypothetical protein